MGKKVEEEMPDMGNIRIANVEEKLVEVPKAGVKAPTEKQSGDRQDNEPVNCLRNERVYAKFVPSPNAMIQTPGHVLYGGMADNATRKFPCPRLRTGQYANVLTNEEKRFLEKAMGLEKDALSVYRKHDNFWDDNNPNGIGAVILRKQNNYFNLSVPEDYIRWKILLSHKDIICPSMQELEDRPKATYQFVLVSENAEAMYNLSRNDAKRDAYVSYGAVCQDADTLRTILEIITSRPLAQRTRLDFLQGKTMETLEKDPRRFLSVIKDKLLPAKVLIKRAVEAGIVTRKNDLYFYEGMPMCEMGEDSTLTNAAKYITHIKRQEMKYTIEAKLKQE